MGFNITEFNYLIKYLRRLFEESPNALVGIDGVCPGGRAILARELSRRFNASVIDADAVPAMPTLRNNVREARLRGGVFVEGGYLRRRFNECELRPDMTIYVIPAKGSARRQLFEDILTKSLSEVMERVSDRQEKEMVKYHRIFRPVLSANFLVEDKLED